MPSPAIVRRWLSHVESVRAESTWLRVRLRCRLRARHASVPWLAMTAGASRESSMDRVAGEIVDLLVIGAGILGASTALAVRPGPSPWLALAPGTPWPVTGLHCLPNRPEHDEQEPDERDWPSFGHLEPPSVGGPTESQPHEQVVQGQARGRTFGQVARLV